jgi:probable rRNA maturation factor
MCIACILRIEMEESNEQLDQPPPANVTIQGDADVQYKWLKENTNAALLYLNLDNSEVAVKVVDDKEMSELHVKHSSVEGTTDVLTFDHGSDEQGVRADIAVCVDVARREAEIRGHPLQNELLLYILHGILHCCGFDDHDDESHQQMHSREDQILKAIGVGSVWSSKI